MSRNDDAPLLDRLVNDVLDSAKYRDVSPELIRSIGMQELARRRNLKEAVKATKNKLHQVGGSYFSGQGNYAAWLDELAQAACSMDPANLRRTCLKIMGYHASNRERLPILEQFYHTILADLPPIHSVLDVACGLNPLAIPWMPLAEGARYYACDIYQHMIDMLNGFLSLVQIEGKAYLCDAIQGCPPLHVDVAYLLKVIPCLEQIDKQAGYRLLRAISAQYLVVSFPVHSLGGYSKGMATNYEAHFWELVNGEPWQVKKFEFATELVFLVRKQVH
jgi:16S rRNA (guanine(1405)-N(7))-methyltransferase